MEETDRRQQCEGTTTESEGTKKKHKSAKIKKKTTWRKLNRLDYEEERKEEG